MKKAIERKAYNKTVSARKSSSTRPHKTLKKGVRSHPSISHNLCKVTFRLPKKLAHNAKTATIVGDFNNWNPTEHMMKKLKNGDFTLTIDLPCDREYSFRYLIDTAHWENSWFADKYIPDNSDADK